MKPADRQTIILCVEDEIDLRMDIIEELETAGYLALGAGDGSQALALLESHRPDLILCDITMPGMNGYELMEHMRAERPDLADVPFVFLTALAGRMDLINGMRSGADDYLVKPIDYDVLLATLKARLSQVQRIQDAMARTLEDQRLSMTDTLLAGVRETVDAVAASLDHLATGFMVLDQSGQVIHANATAKAITEDGDVLLRTPAGLSTVSRTAARDLRGAFADIAAGIKAEHLVAVPRDYGNPVQIHLRTLPAATSEGPAIAAVLIDPDRRRELSADTVIKTYALTPSEARLCVALANGKRLDEIGTEFGIAPTTIAFHLQNVFRKTQTNRQSELVLLLNRISFG